MPNIIFLYGNDELPSRVRIREFEADFTDPTTADMNTARLEARSMSEDELNNAVNAMPFLAPKRLVILGNPSARYNNPSTRKKFEEFISKSLIRRGWLCMKSVEPKEAEKHWLMKWAGKNSTAIKTQAFMLPRQKDMPDGSSMRRRTRRQNRSAGRGEARRNGRRGYASDGHGNYQTAGVC